MLGFAVVCHTFDDVAESARRRLVVQDPPRSPVLANSDICHVRGQIIVEGDSVILLEFVKQEPGHVILQRADEDQGILLVLLNGDVEHVGDPGHSLLRILGPPV